MKKEDYFKTELNYIRDDRLREGTKRIIRMLPDYFFEIPASSTGKYHPHYVLGEVGLVRHTKVVVRIAHELLNNNKTIGDEFTEVEKDIILIALLIHDGFKSGLEQSKYTVIEHPLLISKFISDNYKNFALTVEEMKLMTSILETHMGEWTKNWDGQEVLRKPQTKYEKFGHMCDYLASKKFLKVEFKNNEIV